MFAYEREQKSTLIARLDEQPARLIILTGPRQSGKTTLIQQVLNSIDRPRLYLSVDAAGSSTLPEFLNLDESGAVIHTRETAVPAGGRADAAWLVRQWERARREADRSRRGFILVLDEIQKIPNWSETVKGLWDADRLQNRQLHVVLLGSAPLLMQQGLTESLAGRFETIRLAHWSFGEMSVAFGFDLDRYIFFGGYPGAAFLVSEQDRWRAYILDALVETNIERDVLAMQRVDKPVLLKRLFELGAAYSGQILSYTKMLGSLQDAGNTTTLARYLDLFSSVGLIAGLPKYASHTHRRGSSPKLNVFNTALMSAGSEYSFQEAKADRSFWGRLVESAVGAHLLNTAKQSARLYYWRYNGCEVDFVLARARRLVAVEVKSGLGPASLSGLDEFERQFRNEGQSVARIVVGEGGVSLPEFLSTPALEWLEDS